MKIKKILMILAITIFAFSVSQVVYGASAAITTNNKEIEIDQTATITIKAEEAAAWNLDLTSNAGDLTIASKIALAGASSDGNNCNDTITTATFSAKKAGEYTITLSGQAVDFDETSSKVSKTIKIKVIEPQKSSNNNLKMLGIKPNDFSNFKSETTTYNISVPYDVSKVNVYAEKAEDSQTISGTGDVNLKEGKNTVSVVCTAEDGTTKTYTMYITREAKVVEEPVEEKPEETPVKEPEKSSNNKLKMLGITPNDFRNFKSGTTTYYITVPYEVSEVNVYAEKDDPAQTISGTGDVNLKVGKNTVRVVCTAEDGTTKTYTMYITREAEIVEEQEEEPEETETPVEEEPVEEEPATTEEPTDETEDKTLGITGLNIVAKTEDGKELLPELSPAFIENVYEYMLAVPISVTDIEVTAQTEAGTPKIEVMGNKNLAEGENLVTAIVEVGNNTKIYQITVTKTEQITETVLSNEIIMQLAIIAAVATLIIVAIIAIIIMIVRNKRKDKKQPAEQPILSVEESTQPEQEKTEEKVE